MDFIDVHVLILLFFVRDTISKLCQIKTIQILVCLKTETPAMSNIKTILFVHVDKSNDSKHATFYIPIEHVLLYCMFTKLHKYISFVCFLVNQYILRNTYIKNNIYVDRFICCLMYICKCLNYTYANLCYLCNVIYVI